MFLKWTFPYLQLDTSNVANRYASKQIQNGISNSVDPGKMARLDLHCLQNCLFLSTELKGVIHE